MMMIYIINKNIIILEIKKNKLKVIKTINFNMKINKCKNP